MRDLVKGMVVTARSPRQGAQLPVIRQFVKFSMVGVVNTVTSFSVYEAAKHYLGLVPLTANALAFCVGVTVSYLLNKRWTFRNTSRRHHELYARFFLINIGGLLISETVIYLVHNYLGFHDRLAFASSVVVVVFWNFNANRAWTFKQPVAQNDKSQ